jgi:enoyl-[acyl-carrier protein] reductase I
MAMEIPRSVLKGAKALIVGIANKNSIAYGCAKALRELGADFACAYLATHYVRRLSGETLFADGG